MSGVRSEAGIESRGLIVPVKVGILDAMGRRSRGPRLREIRGQTEVSQDPFHRASVFNQREEPQPPATTGALRHIEPKRPSHQIRQEIRTVATWWWSIAPLAVGRA